MDDEDSLFDKVLESVGDRGFFQKRFNYLYNLLSSILGGMIFMNIILAMTVPSHWCHVPGRNGTNYTLEEWRTITLPRENDSSGLETFSSCQMFNITKYEEHLKDNYKTIETTSCQFGYEYDTTWFTSTIPSQQDWVCEKELHVTNAFTFTRIGEVVGTFVFGQLADKIGRRPVYYIAVVFFLAGRLLTTFGTSWYPVFLISVVLAMIGTQFMFSCPLGILMEISNREDRCRFGTIQSVGFTIGVSLLPLLMWWLRDWLPFLLISSIPIAAFLLMDRFMVESPRWLYSSGKVSKCIKVLKRIAKVNGTALKDDAMALLQDTKITPEKNYGMMSLFSNWRLAKNSILLALNWAWYFLAYYILILNVANLNGNPHLNLFYQTLVELPSYFIGKILCDKYGRRFTALLYFTLGSATCFGISFIINNQEYAGISAWVCILAKFFVSFFFVIANLQSMEIYPTTLRQTGIAFCIITANILGIFSGYITLLGTTYDARYPYLIMGGFLSFGAMAQIFLPETLNHKLPETLTDAYVFGKDQPYFSLPKKILNTDSNNKHKDMP